MQKSHLARELVAAIAAELERRAERFRAIGGMGERADLEPAAVAAISPAFTGRVEKDRRVAVPKWASVGNVDLVVRSKPGSDRLAWVAELKWCRPGDDILYEAVWDLLKMALVTTREERPSAYLITGAEKGLWRVSPFADLFDEGEHDPAELCFRELNDRANTLAWDDLLRGGYDRYPDAVPARLHTSECGRAPVGDWELRAVEVSVSDGRWISMDGGWPSGHRPSRARRPL